MKIYSLWNLSYCFQIGAVGPSDMCSFVTLTRPLDWCYHSCWPFFSSASACLKTSGLLLYRAGAFLGSPLHLFWEGVSDDFPISSMKMGGSGFLSYLESVLRNYIPRQLYILRFRCICLELSKGYSARTHFVFNSKCMKKWEDLVCMANGSVCYLAPWWLQTNVDTNMKWYSGHLYQSYELFFCF